MSDILWLASNQSEASLVLPSVTARFESSVAYKKDGISEKLVVYEFDNKESLSNFLVENVGKYKSEASCIYFLYSLVLSKGLKAVLSDMDEGMGTLIGSHGYCTQEMVNLILTGKSVSNVFDGTMELGTDASEAVSYHEYICTFISILLFKRL